MKISTSLALSLIEIACESNQPFLSLRNPVTQKIANKVIKKLTPSQNEAICKKIYKLHYEEQYLQKISFEFGDGVSKLVKYMRLIPKFRDRYQLLANQR